MASVGAALPLYPERTGAQAFPAVEQTLVPPLGPGGWRPCSKSKELGLFALPYHAVGAWGQSGVAAPLLEADTTLGSALVAAAK